MDKTYTADELRYAMCSSPDTHYWLKGAIEYLWHTDPVDALHDAEALTALMRQRLDEMQGEAPQ